MMLRKILLLLSFLLVFTSCGKIVGGNESNSKVYGLVLEWENQPSISLDNINNYPLSGRCISELGDVVISISDPVLAQTLLPCLNNRFSGFIDLSASGLPDDDNRLTVTHVLMPIQDIASVVKDITPPLAPTITSPVNGSVVIVSAQTVTGSCQPAATVRLFGNIVGSPVTTICTVGGTYSRSVTLTAPDGFKTISAEQIDAALNVSPSVSVTVNLSPMVFAVTSATTVNLALVTVDGTPWNVDWGDGSQTTNISSSSTVYTSHTYGSAFTGNIRFEGLVSANVSGWRSTLGNWSYNVSTLPTALTYFSSIQGQTTGDISTLPNGLLHYENLGQNTTSGNINSLPPGLTHYENRGNNTTTGDLASLPIGIVNYNNGGNNTVFGNINSLPANINFFYSHGQNTINGDIVDLPASLVYYDNNGQNTVTGDIANLKPNLTTFRNYGNNTTFGDIANLSGNIVTYVNSGNNTTMGDIGNLKNGLLLFATNGANTITGDIANLPTTLSFFSVVGVNTIFGDLNDLKTVLTTFNVGGLNTIQGDIGDLKSTMRNFTLGGNNTSTGSIASLPSGLLTFVNGGNNTTFGNIGSLPSTLRIYTNTGLNTTNGSINMLPATLYSYINSGNNTTTSTGVNWSSVLLNFNDFHLLDSTVRSQLEIDNILVALANVTTWSPSNDVDLRGAGNATPGAAGIAAIATITSRGGVVYTN